MSMDRKIDISQAEVAALVPPGTTVAIVAPCGSADPAIVQRGLAVLEALGCRVRNFYRHEARFQRFGATDEARAAQLMQAASDPEVDVILCLRGSYGMSRIMPLLDLGVLAACGKPIIGYSDVTVLQLALLRGYGTISFAGPMLADFGREPVNWPALGALWRTLTTPRVDVHDYQGPDAMDRAPSGDRRTDAASPVLQCEGTLWGGNLAMVSHLAGSDWMPRIDGGILFLEDVNEHPFRVERMLLQLAQSGVLHGQRAILLGDFAAHRLAEVDNGYDFSAMLAYLRSRIDVPIVTGLPHGHVRDMVTLPQGAHAQLDARGAAGFTLALSGYPVLAAAASRVATAP